VWWNRAVTFQAERQQIFLAWQKSEDQLQQAMQTIDQMAATEIANEEGKPGPSPAVLIKAKQFYERLLQQDGPPARHALVHLRLAKIHERLGEHREAQASYQAAITRWEKLAQEWPDHADYHVHLKDGRQRMQALAGRAGP
jgi:tetratricopeptide (TPR) repeat protein